ncbi:MAG TPA: ATP-binding protein, partial [Methylomirabilota bacterium]|nr:ATP-binding protein [Methylomirabilota bacterium]
SGDDRWLALTEPLSVTNLLLVDLTSGRLAGFAPGPIRRQVIRLDPAGTRLALHRDSALEVWDRDLSRRMDSLPLQIPLSSVEWDTAGRRLALGDARGDIRLWDVATGQVQLLAGHAGTVTRLAFSPDGAWLASTSFDGTSRLWDLTRGQAALTTGEGKALSFDASGGRLGFEQRGLGLGLWRIQTGLGHRVLRPAGGRTEAAYKLDLSPDGRWLAWAKADALHVWDLDTGGLPSFRPMTNLLTTFWESSRPELFLLFHDRIERRTIGSGDAAAGEAIRLGTPVPVPLPAGFAPRMAVVSGDGQTLAVAGANRRVVVLGVGQSEPRAWLAGACNPVGPLGSGSGTGSGRMALDTAGRWLATCDMYQTPGPHVWDARTGTLIRKLPTGTATVGFSRDGWWLATCGREEIALWSTDAWTNVWRAPRWGQPPLEGVLAFNGDGSRMVVAKSHQLVQLLDTRSGAELATFTAPNLSALSGLRFSVDGRRIVVGLENDGVQVWDLPPIRGELAKLGLDWEPPRVRPLARAPGALRVVERPFWIMLVGLGGVVVATVIAVLALRRHRRLVHEFVQSEATAQARQRELEMARVELMHSQKMKALGTLAAGIAHDFNNLLSVIRMSNQLIGRATKGRADVAEEVGNIEEAVLQGKQVVASMLGYSRERPEADGVCDVDEVVEETVSLLSREFLSGIELTLALDRHAPPVRVGRGRIEQILLNLVVNASEAMKGQGRLEIGVRGAVPEAEQSFVLRPRPAAHFVELTVADSGHGIAPDILPRIFEPFFTTKNTGTRQGTGLGLSMVYTIAEQEGLGLA